MAESSKRPRLDPAVENDVVDDHFHDLGSFFEELSAELAGNAFSAQIDFSDQPQAIATQLVSPSDVLTFEIPVQLQQEEQQQRPPTGDSMRRMIQKQLILLLHAHKCHQREMTKGVASQSCQLPHCQAFKDVLKHMSGCHLGKSCRVPHCASSKSIIMNWKKCGSDCNVCVLLRNSCHRPGAVSTVFTQTTGVATHQIFQPQQQPGVAQPHFAQAYAALGLPLPCQQQAVTNVPEQVPSASSSAFPLATPGISASHLVIPMSATASRSSDMGAQQQHTPTMAQQILDIRRNLELHTLGTLSGTTFTGETPSHAVDDWRQSVTQDLHKHLVCKIAQAIYPFPVPASSHDLRIPYLVQFARIVESDMFYIADSREEFYHLLAEKIYKIKRQIHEKRLGTLGISDALTLEATSHKVEDWRHGVSQGLRQHLVHKLVQTRFPSADPTSLHDERILNFNRYASEVEGDMYKTANSREEYYHLLVEKINKIQKDLAVKRKLGKQQGNDVLVQKMAILRKELHALQPQSGYSCIEVSRKAVFEESYSCIMKTKPERLRKRLMVTFRSEEGVDYGGVAREWLYLLSHEMLNPHYSLFQYSRDDIYTLQINPDSGINPEHLSYFHFVGRIIGIAIFHGHYLDGGFTMPFYKQLLGKPITLDDLESVDPDLHRSLVWILDNDITGIIDHGFCVDHEAYGERIVHDLKPGGKDIPVTEENKNEYVNLYVHWRFMRGIEAQFRSLQKGFNELISQHLLRPFDERELELVIGGLRKIDVEDWKKNTRMEQCTSDSNIVKWFWRAVEEFDEERRARLLQFVTGNSRVPLQGFKALQGSTRSQETGLFTIHQADTSTDSLPKACTCFNRIDIPPYESYEKFMSKLTCAVDETNGFTVV